MDWRRIFGKINYELDNKEKYELFRDFNKKIQKYLMKIWKKLQKI